MVAVISVVSVLSSVMIAVSLGISGLDVLRQNRLTEVASQEGASDGVVASKHLCVINRAAGYWILPEGLQRGPKVECLRVWATSIFHLELNFAICSSNKRKRQCFCHYRLRLPGVWSLSLVFWTLLDCCVEHHFDVVI